MYKQHNIKPMVIQIAILDLLYMEEKDVVAVANLYDASLSKTFIFIYDIYFKITYFLV
jgi:hypothetical protein